MDLADLEWGDVLADTGEVLVCQARHDEDQLVVKRWKGTALDAELTARRLLAEAGISQPELLGAGPGWLALEDLAETMWRPATAADLNTPATLAALARWFARVHQLEPVGLPQYGEVQDGADPAPCCLVVGSFELSDLAVVGAGMDAMATDLSLAHAGHPADDLLLVGSRLAPEAWPVFLEEYQRMTKASAPTGGTEAL